MELSIEEKAKRYDEALEKAKSKIKNDKDHVLYEDDIVEIFHELKESEDEKVIRDIKVVLESSATKFFKEEGKMPIWYDRAIAWLAKQREQKSAWGEEDEKMLNSFLHKLEVCDLLSNKEGVWIKNKLKNIKDRVQPQSAWKPSDEQMKWFGDILDYHQFSTKGQKIMQSLYNDLKKLKG